MKRNTLFSILATAAFGIVMAGPANAADPDPGVYRTQATGYWNVSSTWEVSILVEGQRTWVNAESYPQTGDTANILNGHTVTLQQDDVAGKLNVNSGGIVAIPGQTLTLDGAVTHDIDGDILLQTSGSHSVLKVTAAATMDIAGKVDLQVNNARLDLDANVTVQGAGQIEGQNDAAEVQIAANTVLTSTMSTVGIVGNMKIVGQTPAGPGDAGKLDNRGLVYANSDGTLALGENLLLADTGAAVRWKAGNNGSAILFFRNAHTGSSKLKGDFAVANCAKLKFDETIETNGDFDTSAAVGLVDVDAGNNVEFRYDCGAIGGCTVIKSDQSYGGC